jgi:hypothetical protein
MEKKKKKRKEPRGGANRSARVKEPSSSPAAVRPFFFSLWRLLYVYSMYGLKIFFFFYFSLSFTQDTRKKVGFSLSILENDFLVGFRMDAQSYTPLQSNL